MARFLGFAAGALAVAVALAGGDHRSIAKNMSVSREGAWAPGRVRAVPVLIWR